MFTFISIKELVRKGGGDGEGGEEERGDMETAMGGGMKEEAECMEMMN